MARIPERDEVTPQQLVTLLAKAGRAVSLREIAGEMNLRHHGRRSLTKVVAKMLHKGDLESASRGRIQLPAPGGRRGNQQPSKSAQKQQAQPAKVTPASEAGLIRGRLVAHRDGYGFVVPGKPIPGLESDIFIGRDAMADAMHGDTVLVKILRREPDGRASGRIIRVAERANPTVVGLFRYGSHENVVLPYEARISEIVIPPGEELTNALAAQAGLSKPTRPRQRFSQLDGAVVNVEILKFPQGGLPAAGRVIEILGRPGDMGVDIEIIIRKHQIPHVFGADVLAEAAVVAHQPDESTFQGRRDFRDLPIVTIDGETARDFDDAVYVERHGSRWHLQVHIADVANYVRRDAALDREARLRGTSVYFPDRAVPMLPEALSNDICSLKPQVDRLVMSVLMELSETGEILSAEMTPGVIRSAARMTYTNVFKVLEGDAQATAEYSHLAPNFFAMRELAEILIARRRKLGSIDFDLPEPVIEFDPDGRMTDITRSERNIAHRLIEEFMLCTNQAVARHLEKRGLGFLHRVHEKPDAKKVLEFEELVHAFGYSLGVPGLFERRVQVRHGTVIPKGREGRSGRGSRERPMFVSEPGTGEIDIRPEHYQRLAEKLAGKPEERILSYLMLRSLKQARYAAEPLGHFALAFKEYGHFTSPIRRYPDLIVHRVLKWALENPHAMPHAGAKFGVYSKPELESMADETSEAERRAVAAERELMDWKTAQFMESRLGEEYEALIISVQKFGFFVELVEVFVEGLVPINRLEEQTGDRCVFRERDHAIVAQRRHGDGKSWHLGDMVHVVAERIDPLRRRVEFALAK
jgi:ribonuclease R